MQNKSIQFTLASLAVLSVLPWYLGVWQRTSVMIMIALAALLAIVQIAADLNMPPTDRPSSAMARPRNRMWIKLRIGFTLTLVALGSGIWLRSV